MGVDLPIKILVLLRDNVSLNKKVCPQDGPFYLVGGGVDISHIIL